MEIQAAVEILSSLASEPRLAVFRVLVQHGPEGLMAGEIGKRLEMPHSTLSFHLNHLRHAGLVTRLRKSRAQIYSARYDTMNALVGYLTENCCTGQIAVTGTLVSAIARNQSAPNPAAPTQKGTVHERSRRVRKGA